MLKQYCLLSCFLALAGCALTRGELDLRVEEIANPNSTKTVKIVEVVDRRVFQVDPPKPFIPSLSNNEVNDRSVQKRAVARKRNTYGAAMGDIVLPEGRTVEQLTKEALTRALREAGVRVVSEGVPGHDAAIPLRAEIKKFWAWVTPGFWQITLQYEIEVTLIRDWPVAEGNRKISADARVTGAMASSTEWKELFDQGIRKLMDNTRQVIRTTSDKISRLFGREVPS